MVMVVLRLVLGCAVILLGRWMYRNPQRVYVGEFYSDRETPAAIRMSRLAIRLTRLFATLTILSGLYVILTLATVPLAKGLEGVFLGLGLSAILAWYLRPRVPQTPQPRLATGRARGAGLKVSLRLFVGATLATGAAAMATIVASVRYHFGSGHPA